MKQHPKGIRLDPDVLAEVQKIAEVTGLPQTEVIRQLVSAGARAIKENGYKLPLPLVFKAYEADPSPASPPGASYPPARQQVARAEDKPASSCPDPAREILRIVKKHYPKGRGGGTPGGPK